MSNDGEMIYDIYMRITIIHKKKTCSIFGNPNKICCCFWLYCPFQTKQQRIRSQPSCRSGEVCCSLNETRFKPVALQGITSSKLKQLWNMGHLQILYEQTSLIFHRFFLCLPEDCFHFQGSQRMWQDGKSPSRSMILPNHSSWLMDG